MTDSERWRHGPLAVRGITAQEHHGFVDRLLADGRPVSYLQTPAWAEVEDVGAWESRSVGWFTDEGDLVGAARLVLRPVPRARRWSLAYLPEGPALGEHLTVDPDRWLEPLVAHLRTRGCFGVRIGPTTVVRRWEPRVVRAAVGRGAQQHLLELPASEQPSGVALEAHLRRHGWRPQAGAQGLGTGFPQYNAQVPLVDGAGRALCDDDLRGQMNRLWRRTARRAEEEGVTVAVVAPEESGGREELGALHRLYVDTAERDGFDPWPLAYFTSMVDAFTRAWPGCLRLWSAWRDDEQVAALLSIHLGPTVSFAYGAASRTGLQAHGTYAVQWAALRWARDVGANAVDLRGVEPSLGDGGLLRFKAGMGAQTVQYVGEWDLPLNRLLYRAYDLVVNRR